MDAVEFSWSEKEAKIISEGLYCASLYPQLKKFAVRQQKQFADYEEYFGFMEILAVCQEGKSQFPGTCEKSCATWQKMLRGMGTVLLLTEFALLKRIVYWKRANLTLSTIMTMKTNACLLKRHRSPLSSFSSVGTYAVHPAQAGCHCRAIFFLE